VSNAPTLTIGYSTLAERVSNIRPPKLDLAHEVYISIQNPMGVTFEPPKTFEFRTSTSSLKGVAKSRNVVIDNSISQYILFADDEITFNSAAVEKAVTYLETHPGCDLVLAQTVDTNGAFRKKYPVNETKLNHFNCAKAATYEMLIRTDSIRAKGVRFDESFGAGVENYLGDEYIFITDLLKKKGAAVFLPLTIAVHPIESSGSGWGTPQDLRARAAVFGRVFGFWAPVVRLAFYLKSYRKTPGLASLIGFIRGK
jgi:hypothetical protein